MTYRFGRVQAVDRFGKLLAVEAALGDLELLVADDAVLSVDEAQLEGTRAGVQNEDLQEVSRAISRRGSQAGPGRGRVCTARCEGGCGPSPGRCARASRP